MILSLVEQKIQDLRGFQPPEVFFSVLCCLPGKLKVPELIDLVTGKIPDRIVGSHSFNAEKLRQTVVYVGESGVDIELVLDLQDMLAEVGHVVAVQAGVEAGLVAMAQPPINYDAVTWLP